MSLNKYQKSIIKIIDLLHDKEYESALSGINEIISIAKTPAPWLSLQAVVLSHIQREDLSINVLQKLISYLDDDKVVSYLYQQSQTFFRNLPTKRTAYTYKVAYFDQLIPLERFYPFELQGYHTEEKRYLAKIDSPLKLSSTLFEDQKGTRFLIVALDIFGVDPSLLKLCQEAASYWGISKENILINSSHTHYGPGVVNKVLSTLGEFQPKIVELIGIEVLKSLPKLIQSLEPACVFTGLSKMKLGFNRRYIEHNGEVSMKPNEEDNAYPEATPYLKVLFENNQKKDLYIINHGCHPTGLSSLPVLSSDYVGDLRDFLSTSLNADIVFLQGCAADIKIGLKTSGQAHWPKSRADITFVAQTAALSFIQNIHLDVPISGDIISKCSLIHIPMRSPQESLNARYASQWKRDMLSQTQTDHLEVCLSSISLGEHIIISLPGEPATAYSTNIRQLLNQSTAFILGYTNGLQAYFPTDQMIEEGGYESDQAHMIYLLPGPFQKGLEYQILSAVVNAQPTYTTPLNIAPSAKKPQAFFVLSTGRSGTQTLAHLMKDATNAKVWHHPEPNMIKETLYAYWNRLDHSTAFWMGRSHIISQAWNQNLIHGETDHNMTPFAHAIAKDIPSAKFLVLIRDPRDFIRSGMRRGYYQTGGPWDEGRLRPLDEEAKKIGWSNLHPFEKVCWLWAETYQHILHRMEIIGEDRVKVVRFEDLIETPQVASDIFDFLGLNGFSWSSTEEVLSQKLNAQKVGAFPHPTEWSEKMHNTVWGYCGSIAERFGYKKERYKNKRGQA